MSDNKFTKGEWFVVESDNEITVTCEDYDIFTCWTDAHDAGLVAAAPEMYEILNEILTYDAFRGSDGIFGEEIQRILKKARGEHV